MLLPFLLASFAALQTPDNLLSQMTLEEKVAMCRGNGDYATNALPRLGLPPLFTNDGPQGYRQLEGKPTTWFPTGIALASTWNPQLAMQEGAAIGSEAKSGGVGVILGPAINMIRIPLGGRSFEYMSEDPFLAGQMAAGYIQGVQSQGICACVKHFAANSEEIQRGSVDARMDERTLREIYLPAFETAVKKGKPWVVMAAYNKVNGQYCTENAHLLTDILKNEWGFRGFVMSDDGATHSTVPAALAGLDWEIPGGPDSFFGNALLDAVKAGKVPERVVDDKVRRILRGYIESGYFKNPHGGEVNAPAHQQLTRKIADEAIVLLKNRGNLLPLNERRIKSIAVIGPNADAKFGPGGGSSEIHPPFEITTLAGLRLRCAGHATVLYSKGAAPDPSLIEAVSPANLRPTFPEIELGLTGHYFTNRHWSGKPAFARVDDTIDFDWDRQSPDAGFPRENFSVRWTGFLIPDKTGTYSLGTFSDDGSRVWLDDKLVIDNGGEHGPGAVMREIPLVGSRRYRIRIDYFQAGGQAEMRLIWSKPYQENPPWIQGAVRTAKSADAAVVVVGTNHAWDTEGSDKPNLNLMGDQARLISAVAKANPHTIVVLLNGSAVVMDPWLAHVPAVVEAWYPGMEGGQSIASVLFGDVNPSGRLPITFPKRTADVPALANGDYPPKDGVLRYDEGILMGYRWYDTKHVEPLFPFGFGLSYTRFAYSGLHITKTGNGAHVSLRVRNTGRRAGKEVVELYLSDGHAPVLRPEKELKAFAKVDLKPGQATHVSFDLDPRAFAYYNVAKKGWTIAPGRFRILVGSSSRDVKLSRSFTM